MFGKVPNVEFSDALNDFLKVEELHKNKSKGNLLHLAKVILNELNNKFLLNDIIILIYLKLVFNY